jgi:hypothetical protein
MGAEAAPWPVDCTAPQALDSALPLLCQTPSAAARASRCLLPTAACRLCAVLVMTTLYLAVACSGYAAFGNSVAGSIMTAFTHPAWLVNLANAMVGAMGWGGVGWGGVGWGGRVGWACWGTSI